MNQNGRNIVKTDEDIIALLKRNRKTLNHKVNRGYHIKGYYHLTIAYVEVAEKARSVRVRSIR